MIFVRPLFGKQIIIVYFRSVPIADILDLKISIGEDIKYKHLIPVLIRMFRQINLREFALV